MPNAQHDFRSVLIVDEDAGIRKLLRSQLDNIGFNAIAQIVEAGRRDRRSHVGCRKGGAS